MTVYDFVFDDELDPVYVANGTFMPNIVPEYRIPGATYSAYPELPYGLSINPINGVVSGRPNQTMELTAYTLFANISGYSMNVPINIAIFPDNDLDGLPDELPEGENYLTWKKILMMTMIW